MAHVLFVKANDRSSGEAISVKMYDTFLQSYKKSHPEDEISELDLHERPLPYLGASMIKASSKASKRQPMTEEEEYLHRFVTDKLEQFLSADKIVLAFPLWNLTVPAVLHSYLDYMHHPGKTFSYSAEGATGLLKDKKAVLLNARGGAIKEEDPAELAVRFVKAHLNFFGITDITTCVIEGHHQFPERSEQIINDGLKRVEETAQRVWEEEKK